MRRYYVYVMASKSRVLYVGITDDIWRRVWEHKNDIHPGFTSKYRVHRLVYFESFKYVGNAIAREKRIKGWLREKKVAMIRSAKSHLGRLESAVVRRKECQAHQL